MIARDVDIVEESVVKLGAVDAVKLGAVDAVKLGAVDAVKLGMFRFRLGLLFGVLQHLFFFRETVSAGSFGFHTKAIPPENTAITSTTLHHFLALSDTMHADNYQSLLYQTPLIID